ncbi:MAG: hypothetical protein Q4D35_03195 [Ruminococcus sp.]|nr:hypothetical protein [Ruminococcus sp.]
MYPGIKDTVRSEMRDKYESRIEQLTKENKQLRWQVAHPIFKITTLGGGYDDDGTEDTE